MIIYRRYIKIDESTYLIETVSEMAYWLHLIHNSSNLMHLIDSRQLVKIIDSKGKEINIIEGLK